MFVDLDWPLNASSLLSASAELLVSISFSDCLPQQYRWKRNSGMNSQNKPQWWITLDQNLLWDCLWWISNMKFFSGLCKNRTDDGATSRAVVKPSNNINASCQHTRRVRVLHGQQLHVAQIRRAVCQRQLSFLLYIVSYRQDQGLWTIGLIQINNWLIDWHELRSMLYDL